MSSLWLFILLSCAIALPSAILSMRMALKARGRRTRASAPTARGRNRLQPRATAGYGGRHLRWQILVLLCFLVIAYFESGWSASDFGIKLDVHPGLSATLGLFVYVLYALAFDAIARVLGYLPALEDASFAGLRALWPRGRSQKQAMFLGICINPITEEVIYRGVLVFLAGNLIGSHATTVTLGLLLFWAVHLYQGPRALLSHTSAYAIIIILLYSPLGLLGAIGFHYAGDLIPILTFRRQMNRWIRRHRQPLKAA